MKQFCKKCLFNQSAQSNFPGVVTELPPADCTPAINPTQWEEVEERDESARCLRHG